MNVITKQNVLKAFYQFDKKKMPIVEINGKLSASMDIAMRKRLCDEWLVAFRTVDAVVFDKAAELALASCKNILMNLKCGISSVRLQSWGIMNRRRKKLCFQRRPLRKKYRNMSKNLNGLQNNRVGKSRQVCRSGTVFQNFYRRR